MRRGNHCKLITIHGCGETSWADPVTNVSPPKVSKPSESHKQQKGKTSATSDKSSELDDLRYKIPKKVTQTHRQTLAVGRIALAVKTLG